MTRDELLDLCKSYNIDSNDYGPTIYQDKNNLGLCLDIKDTTFGYLARKFIFQNIEEAKNFLNQYTWYKNNNKNYPLEIKLDNYETENPNIIYLLNNKELNLEDMLNMKDSFNEETISEEQIYKENINHLVDYLINLKKKKNKTAEEKNQLKIQENNLKFDLLSNLTTYYERKNTPDKKNVKLDIIQNDIPFSSLEELKNNENKTIDELKQDLENLIQMIKKEELEEKHIINLYSSIVYEYNINILNKQIDFVKSKIQAEKNFNLKSSKIHNIDEELKSFLNNSTPPIKVEEYLKQYKDKINDKYNTINDLKNAYTYISGNPLNIDIHIKNKVSNNQIINNLKKQYEELPSNTKASLLLYHTLYKDICNFIIDEHYPSIETIKDKFDLEYYYEEIKKIVHDENNNHYFLHVFNEIDFKSETSYIASIINICKEIESIKMTSPSELTLFTFSLDHTLKALSFSPNTSNNHNYILHLPPNSTCLFIPERLIIDQETNEISILETNTIYVKGNMIESSDSIELNIYKKEQKHLKSPKLTITKSLSLIKKVHYDIGYIESEIV